ncbi:hypothetical protein NO2_0319, partial [Candidatus Termititenax persephonae]
MANAGDYNDGTDTDFTGATYKISTNEKISAEGMRNALHTKEKVANKQVDSTDATGTLTASSSDTYYPSSRLAGRNLDKKVSKSGDTLSGRLTGANLKGAWIDTFTTNTALYVPPNDATGSAAQGVLSWRTAQGDGYAINNLNGENRTRLQYATSANITSGTNTTADVLTITGGVVSFAASPTVPGKENPASASNKTVIATEAQVALKQDKIAAASGTADGLMSAADKTKLSGIAENANNYTHPTATEYTSGLYKVTVDGLGHVTAATAATKADITALGIPGSDTTYAHPTATEYTSGLYKVTVDGLGHVTAATAATKADITALGIPGSDTT